MEVFKSRYSKIPGSSHSEVFKAARYEYHKIQRLNPRRQANVKSRYFHRDKIFINQFWAHLDQKHPGDQLRRAKLFVCAIDLLRNTSLPPETIINRTDPGSVLHRFYGQTRSGEYFVVQVRQDKRTGRKDFMSVFPASKKQ